MRKTWIAGLIAAVLLTSTGVGVAAGATGTKFAAGATGTTSAATTLTPQSGHCAPSPIIDPYSPWCLNQSQAIEVTGRDTIIRGFGFDNTLDGRVYFVSWTLMLSTGLGKAWYEQIIFHTNTTIVVKVPKTLPPGAWATTGDEIEVDNYDGNAQSNDVYVRVNK